MRVKISLSLLLLIVVGFYGTMVNAGADSGANDGTIVGRKKYSFPAYEEAQGIEKICSKAEYDSAIKDSRYELEKLIYTSQSLRVVAYLYKPKDTGGQRLPTIIYNRGSYVRGDIAYELAPFFHRLALEGFVILAPLYRGSDGGEGHDELGGADVNDLMNALPLAKSLGFIDTNNLFMYGESRGGMMTFQAIKNGFPINAAAVFGAFTDLESLINSDPDRYQQLIKVIWPDSESWPDFESRKREILYTRSAIKWHEKINVPLLIMHGGADKSVDPAHSLNLAEQLQRSGKKYELVIYADDNHVLSRNQEDRDKRAVSWFRRHIKK